MNREEFRKSFVEAWEAIDEDADSSKFPEIAVPTLENLYRAFDDEQRNIADQIIAEFVTSSDPGKQFDALALVRTFKIRTALPQLLELEASCKRRVRRSWIRSDPTAPNDLEEVRRVIQALKEP